MFNLSDRVRETSLTSGSGSVTFNDTFGGFQSFASGVGNNQTYYAIENETRFEIGIGTINNGVLSRDIVLDSNNASGNKIHLDGVSTIFCTYPASRSVFLNPEGNLSGIQPAYSGIALPDGLVQTRAFLGSGNKGNVSYWSDENTIGGDNNFIWDSASSKLYVNGDTVVSGSFLDAKFSSSSESSLFHAFVDNGNNNIVALHSTDESSATWSLGLKLYSTSFSDPPTVGYVLGNQDQIGLIVNSDNLQILNYSNGFWVKHRGVDLFNIDRNNGINIYNNSAIEVGLTVNAAVGQSSSLQEFKNSSGGTALSISNNGALVFDSQMADVDAPTSSLFYSSNQDKLVFKDKNGSVHDLY